MRVEIQFCELKIKALEKSWEFNILAKTNSDLDLKEVLVKGNEQQNEEPRNNVY